MSADQPYAAATAASRAVNAFRGLLGIEAITVRNRDLPTRAELVRGSWPRERIPYRRPMPANQLTLKDLKSELWRCAEILRGSAVDRTDWKGYILPLLFFKRISDVWDEEAAEAREIFGEIDLADFPELHRFKLPDGCHWQEVRETPSNLGAVLARAMRAIERANPETLTRVFGAADWGNREMLGDELLRDLIEGLSGVPLGNKAVESDILGDAYEYLIGKFADITRRKKAGEFYTPRSVVRMMVELLESAGGREHLRPGLRHRRHAARRDRACRASRRRPAGPSSGASSARRRT